MRGGTCTATLDAPRAGHADGAPGPGLGVRGLVGRVQRASPERHADAGRRDLLHGAFVRQGVRNALVFQERDGDVAGAAGRGRLPATRHARVGDAGGRRVPVPRGYDGDGRLDFVIHRSSTGYWYGLLSRLGYDEAHPAIWHWGTPGAAVGDVPVPADYDTIDQGWQ